MFSIIWFILSLFSVLQAQACDVKPADVAGRVYAQPVGQVTPLEPIEP